MSLHTYEEYEKKRMEKNAWHVCKMVAERIDEASVLNEYINSRVSEPPEELFFFNSTELNTYRNASVNNKMQVPGSAYFTKIEKFIDKHYLAGELFMEFCRIACKEQREGRIILCSWCSSKRWVGPETDRIPQPVPDKNNPGYYMHVYQTKSTDRTPDDYLPRKCLKDLHAQNAIRTDDRQAITSFCSTYNVEEEHVIAYIGHLNDINLRKDIRAKEAKERKRKMEERKYNDYQWDKLIECGKVEKLLVRELDLYLKEHGLTTVGRKLDKIKAIRCHYYREKNPATTNESYSDRDVESSDDSEAYSSDDCTDFRSSDDESCSDHDLLIDDLSDYR